MSPESWRLCPPLAFIHNSSTQRSFQKVHMLPMLDHPEPRLVLAAFPDCPRAAGVRNLVSGPVSTVCLPWPLAHSIKSTHSP